MLSIYLALIETQEDKTLFEEIYYQYRKQMYFVSYKILKDDYLVEDALQNAFMGIATNIVKFRDMAPVKARAYVLTAAKNASINLYNQESKIRETVINLEDMDFVPAADLFEQIEQEDLFTFLLTVIENLPQIHRDVLMLHYVHNMNCAEIAITLGKSHAATRQMLVRARKALQVMCKKVGASLED